MTKAEQRVTRVYLIHSCIYSFIPGIGVFGAGPGKEAGFRNGLGGDGDLKWRE